MPILDYLKITLAYLAIFVVITVLYRSFAAIRFANKNRNFLIAFCSLLIFSSLLMTERLWQSYLFLNGTAWIVSLGLKVMWWLALSFSANQFLDFFLWNGVLKKNGSLVIPILLKQAISLFVYMFFAAGIMHFVFEQPITPLLATSGVVAIVLGYSAQSTLSDVFGGLSLGLSRTFEKGEWIVVNDQLGKVMDMNWRVVTFETEFETEMTIPNSVVAHSKIVNFNRPNGHRLAVLKIHIEKDASLDLVKRCILEAAGNCGKILQTPAPVAHIYEYTAHGVIYRLLFHTRMPFLSAIRDEVYSGLWYALRRDGVSIHRHQISMTDPLEKPIAPDPLEELKPLLKSHEIFAMMTEDEIDQLAQASQRLEVGFPQIMVRQGQESRALYIIANGALGVYIDMDGGAMQNVANLGPSNLFAEISLLTGDLCNATVRADSEAIVYRIDRDALRPVLDARPEIVEKLSELMAERMAATGKAKEDLAKSQSGSEETLASRLAGRIKELFSL
ncbi:MAG: small-conductance mechanosensitive channel/CRP-like cAMP-binding protein [Sulfitobacter sp.]|jgi:small-conductance mechanosensitive channel/CRP-like cAMP-binding protein